jgi:hypothetical protein
VFLAFGGDPGAGGGGEREREKKERKRERERRWARERGKEQKGKRYAGSAVNRVGMNGVGGVLRCPPPSPLPPSLSEQDANGLSDPYCRICVDGQSDKKTTISKKTLDPIWNQIFVFDGGGDFCKNGKIHLKLKDDDGRSWMGRHLSEDLGEVIISVKDIGAMDGTWVEKEFTPQRTKGMKEDPTGR